jgi:conjugative relaxase-like TrwC/TraI family protein
MLSISNPLSASSIRRYHKSEYTMNSHYFTENERLRGEWYGKIAEIFGLSGQQVKDEHFSRLAEGLNPLTGEKLIRHRDSIRTKEGKELGHRAGWDLTLSAPKSVSLAGLVGGDARVIEAHRNAVRATIGQAEMLTQARRGGTRAPETTGKFIVAAFTHDTSRPVGGYAAAQLHTHCVLFNMTEDSRGKAKSLQPHEFFVAAQMLTAIYQNHLEIELRRLGYTITRGKNHAPEIVGFTKEYLASESLRDQQITEEVNAKGLVGYESRSIASHSGRAEKLKLSPNDVKEMHLKNAARFGNQPAQVIAQAATRQYQVSRPDAELKIAVEAVTFARSKLSERESVFDHHKVVTEALRYAKGGASLRAITDQLQAQKTSGHFIEVHHVRPNAPLARYTTPQLIANERYVIERVLASQNKLPPIVGLVEAGARLSSLNDDQARLVTRVLASKDQIMGIQGRAGVGKSFALSAIDQMARAVGYKTQGLAPTSKATVGLKDAGIDSQTLQRFLTGGPEQATDARPKMFFVDETSLASGQQMRGFLGRLCPRDRVVLVGDTAQHESVDAGRIFGELQESGMNTESLSKILRQKDPELRKAVESLAAGDVATAIDTLGRRNRITSIQHRGERLAAIANEYVTQPEGTLIISPDNRSREEINDAVRTQLRAAGKLGPDAYRMRILVNRQNITGADRAVASAYQVGDVLLYRKGSQALGIEKKTYGTVLAVDESQNTVMVQKYGGETVTYNPAKLRGVSVYDPKIRGFAVGDRVQFTAPSKVLGVSNRDLGTVTYLDGHGNIRIQLDSGRKVGFNLEANRHLEHSYAVTSHASQGATVRKVILHVDTGDSRIRALVNDTLAYVGISRAQSEAIIVTDDYTKLTESLSRHRANSTALNQNQIREYRQQPAIVAV